MFSHRIWMTLFVAPVSIALYFTVILEFQHLRESREEIQLHEVLYHQLPLEILEQRQRVSKSNKTLEKQQGVSKTNKTSRPALESLIAKNGTIIGDVQFLLDLAIIGFPKCSTSAMMAWLHQHEQVQVIQDEVWALIWNKPKLMIRKLYQNLPEGSFKRGYKCPADITGFHVMEFYRKYFPRTKLFIGIRNPVWWFESLYNYRQNNFRNSTMPHPNSLIGVCSKGRKNSCTQKGNYALDMMRMGKTNWNGPRLTSELEEHIVGKYRRLWYNVTEVPPLPNPVFLYATEQFGDLNESRQAAFRKDVQVFLGLDTEMPPIPHRKPGKIWNDTVQAEKDAKKIRICDDEYATVRKELVRMAQENSLWIRETFLSIPTIHSSRKHLEEILQGWMTDPCTETTSQAIPADSRAVDQPVDVVQQQATTTAISVVSNYTRPPIRELINTTSNAIIADVSWLVDFAIVGFGKCGTSSFMEWLHQHRQVQCIQGEVWELKLGRPHGLVARLYTELPEGPYKRGYKCPGDIRDLRVMSYYQQYFYKTKLFVGIRNPVFWFQSLWNFRRNNLDSLPHPNQLIGPCMRGMKMTCTEMGNFAAKLMNLGKTNFNGSQPMTDLELQIVGRYKKHTFYNVSQVPYLANDVFLFDVAQMSDSDEARQLAFRHDVQSFLGLEGVLPPLVHAKPGKVWNSTVQALKEEQKIDICDDEYLPVRTELLRLARLSSVWIRTVFLTLPNVYVSSPAYFEELLLKWMDDPCAL